MNLSLNSILLLSLLQNRSSALGSGNSSATSNTAVLPGLGNTSLDWLSGLGSLFAGLGLSAAPSSSNTGVNAFPDINDLTTSNATATTPTIAPAPAPVDDTITLERAGTVPANFDISNPPKSIVFNGRNYNFLRLKKNKKGDITNVIFKSPKRLKLGLNYVNMSLIRDSSSSSSSPSLSAMRYKAHSASPLVFDLSGDGKTKTLAETEQFDIDNDGKLDTINKIDAKDGLLTLDGDNDGVFGEDASEVFGNHTLGGKFDNGFEALRSVAEARLGEEAVADGKLDAAELQGLNLKMKINGEFKSLAELGISQINLNYNANVEALDENGNTVAGRSAFVQNGKSRRIHDIFFKLH